MSSIQERIKKCFGHHTNTTECAPFTLLVNNLG